MKFQSREHVSLIKEKHNEKCNGDSEYLRKVKALDFTMHILIIDCPGGVDKLEKWVFDKGKVVSVKLEEKPAPSDFRTQPWNPKESFLRTTAPYDAFWKVALKEMTPMEGLTKGLYRIDGDMTQLISKLPAITAFTDFSGTIPSEY